MVPISSHSTSAPTVAGCVTVSPNTLGNPIENSQAEHRINILGGWHPAIKSGTRVLELGCGQGTCTEVLAQAVGDTGHVDAIDPGSLDYGAPMTLGQAQTSLSEGLLGCRITWHQADPIEFLSSPSHSEKQWDVAVLAHSIWYFKSPSTLSRILLALKGKVKTICIAEYALHASHPAAVPHVLAAIARANLEAYKDCEKSEENIQTCLSPIHIKDVVERAGWIAQMEVIMVPSERLDDGRWESKAVVGGSYMDEVQRDVSDERTRAMLNSVRDAVVLSIEGIGGIDAVRTMDVWVATLTEGGES